MFARVINLNGGRQVVMMKDISSQKDGPKPVIQIFVNAPEKQKKNVPFVLYFQQVFDTEINRDTVFNKFDEIAAIDLLNQVESKMKVEKVNPKFFN